MALIKCPHCGQSISDKAPKCPRCGYVLHRTQAQTVNPNEIQIQRQSANYVEQQPAKPVQSQKPKSLTKSGNEVDTVLTTEPKSKPISYAAEEPKKGNTGMVIGIIVALLLLAGGVGGWFYYKNIALPAKIDAEALRSYPMSNVNLRSSKVAGVDYNNIATIPYGAELITYEMDSDWARVKVAPKTKGENPLIGYVASPYLLSRQDFFLLNSIYGDTDSKEVIATAKCRVALLKYFKDHQYIGEMSEEIRHEAGITIIPGTDNQWQVFSRAKNSKPNTTLFPRLYNKNSKFTDMLVIIRNISTGERKTLYFYFDDDETSHFAGEYWAPEAGYINKASLYDGYLNIDYSE